MAQMQVAAVTANTQILGAGGRILRSVILNPGSAAATLNIYDNTTNSGTKIVQLVSAANGYSVVSPDLYISLSKGLYAEISGTGATGNIYFE